MFRSLCLLLALLGLFAGCQTPATFPTPTAQWQTLTGQMQYLGPTGKSVVGDVVVRRSHTGDFQLSFASGPGFPLMRLSQSGSMTRAEGVLARGSWQGDPAKAPRHLRGWVQLPKLFEGKGTIHELTATESGERFLFHFGS